LGEVGSSRWVGLLKVPEFTVFTPTFNRADLLGHVHECLVSQTFRDFEWLIVDDGSSDGTADLVRQWQARNQVAIVYLHQENRGKHVAFNRGVGHARGRLFLTLDSDDECVPETLERLRAHWEGIPAGLREGFSGVTCQCMDEFGNVIGTPFPRSVVDAYPTEFLCKQRITGEKWGFHRTQVLREFPFPEIAGERFVPEGLVWNRIGKRYKVRFVSDPLRIYKLQPDGLSSSSVMLRARNPVSTCAYYIEMSESAVPLRARCRALVNYARFYLHARCGMWRGIVRFQFGLLSIGMFPVGLAAFLLDRRVSGVS
jgi:glycosyltransferase involved in cell wall biosynthesis